MKYDWFTFWVFPRWNDWRSLSATSFGEWICFGFCEWNDDIGLAKVVINCLGTSAMFDRLKDDCRRLIEWEWDGLLLSIERDDWTAWESFGLREWRVDICDKGWMGDGRS